MISGKGFFVWRADQVLGRMGLDATAAAAAARSAGVQHVIIKIADGAEPFPIPDKDPGGAKEALTAALIQALQDAGITVWGFSFVYGSRITPESQAQTFAQRATQFGLTGLVINAEGSWKTVSGPSRARTLASTLRQQMAGDVLLALSSYRYPQFHPRFPFAAFMGECDIAMPQVYWAAFGGQEGDAVANLRRCYDEYQALFPRKPFIPTGAAFGEKQADGSFWTATPNQIRRFLDQAMAMDMPAVNFWSWEHAVGDPANPRFSGPELWQTIASYNFTPGSAGNGGQPVEAEEASLEIGVGQPGYFDGLHSQFPKAAFFPFTRQGQQMKYAQTVNTTGSVWAAWVPDLALSGDYEIRVWVPGVHATTQRARYQVHGIVGESQPRVVEVNQSRFFDEWISLGVFALETNMPGSGNVQLSNLTGEEGKEIGFAAVSWQKVTRPEPGGIQLADGFDAPVGTASQRSSAQIWPGQWIDVNPYGHQYTLHGGQAIHTGADLNLNLPGHFDADAHQPVYAVASGVVTFAGFRNNWGNIVIIRHDPLQAGGPQVYSRSAHLESMSVQPGQRVRRGDEIGRIGQGDPADPLPFHLHFDISPTGVLLTDPGDWPGLHRGRVERDYVDPRAYIAAHRPAGG